MVQDIYGGSDMKPLARVLWVPGTNCHRETLFSFEQVGAKAELLFLSELLSGEKKLHDCDILFFCGGFGWGDHLGAGTIMSLDLVKRFIDQLQVVLNRKMPVGGSCNGYQALVLTGLLPGNGELGVPTAILDQNVSARFEHWSQTEIFFHEPKGIDCIWTKGMDGCSIRIPVAHGEGRLVGPSIDSVNVAATYGSYNGTTDYSASPNGSPIAGICNLTGEIFGMMPHAERTEAGRIIFENAVKAVL